MEGEGGAGGWYGDLMLDDSDEHASDFRAGLFKIC